jgi:hypothetical protein
MLELRVFDRSPKGRTRMRSAGSTAEAPAVAGPSPEAICAQLERIVASPEFAVPERLRRFLRYVVEEALAGRADRIKAYTIGVEVFERDDTFDPQNEPVVRIEAGRLRRALEHYYLTAGRADLLLFEVPKGGGDLLGLVPLAWHRGPPWGPKHYLRMDHFTGSGSIAANRARGTATSASWNRT